LDLVDGPMNAMTGNRHGIPHGLSDWLGRRTLILGDVNAGKTRLTADVAARMLRQGHASEMLVLDFAPERRETVGGRLAVPVVPNLLHLQAAVVPPRLAGKTPREVLFLARANARAIDPLIDRGLASGRPILIVNDLTLYLHAGDPQRIHALLDRAETAVVNAYRGRALGDSPLSRKERRRTDALTGRFDRVIRLSGPEPDSAPGAPR
jgi:hypothetical protein